jgi:hypothetical protein
LAEGLGMTLCEFNRARETVRSRSTRCEHPMGGKVVHGKSAR